MLKNITFLVIAAFWLLMNVLLWRQEIGAGSELVASVPVRTVFEKILTAPDASTLGIVREKAKVGYLRWRPVVVEAGATDQIASGAEPEGMVERISQYRIELDGSFLVKQFERSIRMGGEISFDRELKWQQFKVEGSVRPVKWEIQGSVENRDLWIKTEDGEEEWIRRVTFDELRNPGPLLQELNLPMLPLPMGEGQELELPSWQWTAYYDWLRIGQSRVRIYRLEGRLMERMEVVILVSRAGEILKVELPGGMQFLNDALFAF